MSAQPFVTAPANYPKPMNLVGEQMMTLARC
jgi:hypothetical protein